MEHSSLCQYDAQSYLRRIPEDKKQQFLKTMTRDSNMILYLIMVFIHWQIMIESSNELMVKYIMNALFLR